MPKPVFEIPADYAFSLRPHISEWFGHRVFPVVSGSSQARADQAARRCPFLTEALGQHQRCIKVDPRRPDEVSPSEGVCTISAGSNRVRQDWLVCPVRALDDAMLEMMVRRLYGTAAAQPVVLVPAPSLAEPAKVEETVRQVHDVSNRVFVYFHHKLGGEISLRRTPASPAMAFDITIVELLPGAEDAALVSMGGQHDIQLGKYGVVELQTTDTHGSYKQAVAALHNALNLHPDDFHQQLAANTEWVRRKVEGPNISNVFKRTFYQIAFKFQVTNRSTSVGCILALPQPVWDSWRPFLGDPDLHKMPDGTWRLLDDHTAQPRDWIYVFDVAESPLPDGGAAPVEVRLVVGTDAATLSRAALDVAPMRAVQHGGLHDAVALAIAERLRNYLPGLFP